MAWFTTCAMDVALPGTAGMLQIRMYEMDVCYQLLVLRCFLSLAVMILRLRYAIL